MPLLVAPCRWVARGRAREFKAADVGDPGVSSVACCYLGEKGQKRPTECISIDFLTVLKSNAESEIGITPVSPVAHRVRSPWAVRPTTAERCIPI